MQSTSRAPASVHVAFSRKSVVLRTPINWLDDEKFEAKPPPLEFCTNIIRDRKTQTIMISAEIMIIKR